MCQPWDARGYHLRGTHAEPSASELLLLFAACSCSRVRPTGRRRSRTPRTRARSRSPPTRGSCGSSTRRGDSVSVIRTRDRQVIKTIKVGDEPQSLAIDPEDKHVYVANTAAGTVTRHPDHQQEPEQVQREDRPQGRQAGHDHHRRRAVEHRHHARQQARVRGQREPGHDQRHQHRADREVQAQEGAEEGEGPRSRRPSCSGASTCAGRSAARTRTSTSSRAAWP